MFFFIFLYNSSLDEGIVTVKESLLDYPHDALGNKIEKFPIIQHTPDQMVEVDLT